MGEFAHVGARSHGDLEGPVGGHRPVQERDRLVTDVVERLALADDLADLWQLGVGGAGVDRGRLQGGQVGLGGLHLGGIGVELGVVLVTVTHARVLGRGQGLLGLVLLGLVLADFLRVLGARRRRRPAPGAVLGLLRLVGGEGGGGGVDVVLGGRYRLAVRGGGVGPGGLVGGEGSLGLGDGLLTLGDLLGLDPLGAAMV